jgi:hypothetical protein
MLQNIDNLDNNENGWILMMNQKDGTGKKNENAVFEWDFEIFTNYFR